MAMWKRVTILWARARLDIRLLWLALRHPEAPAWLKWGTGMIVLYLLSPVDLIPDTIPVLGLVDDLILIPLAIRWLLSRLPEQVQLDGRQRLRR